MTRRRNTRVTRRSRRGRPGGRGGLPDKNVTNVDFHRINSVTLSGVTGMNTYSVNPQSTQLGAMDQLADQFDLFRVIDLEYRIHPTDPTDSTVVALAFVPDVDIQTTTSTQLSMSPIAAVQTNFSGVPSSWMRVPPSQLKGMLDWYKCTPDAGAAEFESQGLLVVAGGLGDVVYFEVRGVMQFKNPVATAVMMERVIARYERLGLVTRTPKSVSDLQTEGKSCEEVPTGNRMGARPTSTKRPPEVEAEIVPRALPGKPKGGN